MLNALAGVEGPASFRFNDREEWCVLVDRFAEGKGYLPLFSPDFGSGEFRIPEESEYDLGKSKKRHGSVLNLTEEEFQEKFPVLLCRGFRRVASKIKRPCFPAFYRLQSKALIYRESTS